MCGGFFGCVYLPEVLLWGWFMWRIYYFIFFSKGHLANFCIWGWLTAKTTTDPVKTAASLTSRTWWWSEGSHQKMWAPGWLQEHCCRNTAAGAQQAAFQRVLCLDWQPFKDQILFRCWVIYGNRKIEAEPAIGCGCCDITKDWFPMPRVHVHTFCKMKWALQ